MHNNYYFLRCLSVSLAQNIRDTRLMECFSQDKNELILQFENGFNLKAHLAADLSCLSFPENFHKARRNRIDLFTDLIHRKVLNLRQFQNERSFSISFEGSFSLLFKLHGRNANVLLCNQDRVIALFRNNLTNDRDLVPDQLDRPIEQTYAHYQQAGIKSVFPTFDRTVYNELEKRGWSDAPSSEQWTIVSKVVEDMECGSYYLNRTSRGLEFSLFRSENTSATYSDPIEALNRFYREKMRELHFVTTKHDQIARVKKQLKKTKAYLRKTEQQLKRLENQQNYRHWGDNLMANLHQIKPGSRKVSLDDLYTGQPITIKLNPSLSPQKNAERYYNKYKNQHKEESRIRKAVESRKNLLNRLEEAKDQIEAATTQDEILRIAEKSGIPSTGKKARETALPYWKKEIDGFTVLIGRNARANDTLLREHAWKEDLWLHAKDVAGSHVILKYQSNRPYPSRVVEKAAELAAWYSKRRNESVSPVIVTPRKFVRKRKGDPPGAVVVDKEEVLLVTPADL